MEGFYVCAPDGNRTRTRFSANRILSPACLPVPPPGRGVCFLEVQLYAKKNTPQLRGEKKERKTRFEPATLTLAR